ncbi:hypothetical protein yruck0001_5760 [Yersinia ruckeri ATCC 29473]|nr:hypothetical protein yruck0001_5760 [Yersinia ruckeri ATCC 29473]
MLGGKKIPLHGVRAANRPTPGKIETICSIIYLIKIINVIYIAPAMIISINSVNSFFFY